MQAHPVDAVFLDIMMPEMDGMELANQLLDCHSTARVVFVTGYEEYAVRAFELEAADYLLKPVSRERLAKALRRLRETVPPKSVGAKPEITCLGGFRVCAGGSAPVWRSPKTEELFALVVLKTSVSRDEAATILWSGLVPEKAYKNLNATLYYIRRALSACGAADCLSATRRELRRRFPAICTNWKPCWTDGGAASG